ncbi:hypothetical protein DRP07_07240 [Archaeoglobales archaeon]|nr:MAG: hypothetical protein DRP07_07240 [Archaeoglobales archaeon]
MWGIVLIGLLVFVLYHYKPRTSDKDGQFKNALLWSEWGKRFATGQAIVIIWLMYGSEVLWALKESNVDTDLDVLLILFTVPASTGAHMLSASSITFFTFSILLPLIFTWLIHRELVRPLSEDRIPSRRNSRFVFVAGLLFLMLLITPIIAVIPRHGVSVIWIFLRTLSLMMPIFYVLFMASIFSIGVTLHEIRKLRTQHSFIINQNLA